jgi:hypothetical protein
MPATDLGGFYSPGRPATKGAIMADSNELMDELAERAKQASEHVHALASTTKERLDSEVSAARASAEETNRPARAKDSRRPGRSFEPLERRPAELEHPHRRDEAQGR